MPGRTLGDQKVLSRKEQNRINQRACRERKRRQLHEMQQAMVSKEAVELCGTQPGGNDIYRAGYDQGIYQTPYMTGSFEASGVSADTETMPSMVGPTAREESPFVPSQGVTGARQEHAKVDLGTTLMDMSPSGRDSERMLPDGVTNIEMQEEVSKLNTQVDVPVSPTKGVAPMSSIFEGHSPASPQVTHNVAVARAVCNPAVISAIGTCPAYVQDLRAEMQAIRETQTQIIQLLHMLTDRSHERAASQTDAPLQKVVTLEILTSMPTRENERIGLATRE